jgi:hypothetical protein
MNASFFKTLCVAALLCMDGLAAAAPLTHIGQPQYHWSFHDIVADGLGGVKPPTLLFEDTKVGGALADGVTFAPNSSGVPTLHAEVFSKEGGMSFWTKTFSAPAQAFPFEGDTVGGVADLKIIQTFRKDAADGTVNMNITDLFLRARELNGPKFNEGLFGSVVFEMTLFDLSDPTTPVIDAFGNATQLYGRGLQWHMTNTGPLQVDVTAGSLGSASVSVDLLQPYVRPLNVSSIDVGEMVRVEFRVTTTAWDTVQFDSVIQAFGRDPLSPAGGAFFEYEGFTPVGPINAVPEPGTYALMLLGLALLACRKLRA